MAAAGDRIRRSFVDTSDGQIHYRHLGEGGKPLLLLHQTSSSSRMYEAIMPALRAGGYWVIAMDTLGFGDSPPPPSGASVEHYAESVARFVDGIGLSKPMPVVCADRSLCVMRVSRIVNALKCERFACVSRDPLGRPVEPEVKRT